MRPEKPVQARCTAPRCRWTCEGTGYRRIAELLEQHRQEHARQGEQVNFTLEGEEEDRQRIRNYLSTSQATASHEPQREPRFRFNPWPVMPWITAALVAAAFLAYWLLGAVASPWGVPIPGQEQEENGGVPALPPNTVEPTRTPTATAQLPDARTPEVTATPAPKPCPPGYRRSQDSGYCEHWPPATATPAPTRAPAPTQTFGQWIIKEQADLECDPGYHLEHFAVSVAQPYDAKFVCCPTGTRYDRTTDSCEGPATPTPLPVATPTPTRPATPTERPAKEQYLPGYEGPELAIAAMTLLVRGNSGSGSGFFYPIGEGDDAQWAVVTNHHVVEGQKELEVCWAVTQTCRKAEVLHWGSKEFDVAILDYERFNPDEETWSWMWDVALKDWQEWGGEWEKGDVVYASGYPDKATDWYGGYKVPLPIVTEGVNFQGI